ncbi:low molecular weight phosphatase family protein [Microbacterium sp. NPDC057407]|uniref:arsenate reductase/protein-tyrosine-phosphatase family protein n=1 Tax=Microbacterium sp. NPDC057407 TaxID=3346120 RepID=UPI00366C9FF4
MVTPFRILTVCTGNICRSPFAEALLRDRLTPHLPGLAVSSAGTHAVAGHPMQEVAASELARLACDPGDFRSRQLTDSMIDAADLILTMTRGQRTWVLERHPRALRRSFTVREFAALLSFAGPLHRDPPAAVAAAAAARARLAGRPGDSLDVADPYGSTASAYRAMADDLSQAVQEIVGRLPRVPVA